MRKLNQQHCQPVFHSKYEKTNQQHCQPVFHSKYEKTKPISDARLFFFKILTFSTNESSNKVTR